MKYLSIVIAFMFVSPAFAQAPQQQVTASELAINIDNMVNNLAQAMERTSSALTSTQKQLQELLKENADLHKQVDAAKKPAVPDPASKK